MISPLRVKELRLKRQFNLTLDEYNLLGNKCAICGREGRAREISVDHNHKTGETRGRLCMIHNKALALFGDDPNLLQAAIDYLTNPPARALDGHIRYGRTGRVNKRVKKSKRKINAKA